MTQYSTHASNEVEHQEALGAEHILEDGPEHPEREHIEKNVGEAGMHEHVREQLPPFEIGRIPIVQCQVHVSFFSQHILRQKKQNIYDDDVLNDSGHLREAALPGIEHYANVKTIGASFIKYREYGAIVRIFGDIFN